MPLGCLPCTTTWRQFLSWSACAPPNVDAPARTPYGSNRPRCQPRLLQGQCAAAWWGESGGRVGLDKKVDPGFRPGKT